MNLLKSFWSIASPKMLGKCKTGVSINLPQLDKKPKQKGVPHGDDSWDGFRRMKVAEAGRVSKTRAPHQPCQ
jgi:hypothetical protein